mgnify:CR=1 FL=1
MQIRFKTRNACVLVLCSGFDFHHRVADYLTLYTVAFLKNGCYCSAFGIAVIFITHDLGVVANMADRIAIMYAGKIVEYGTADDVFYDPRHPYTWALLSSMPDLETREKLEAIPGTPPDMILPPKGDAFAARNKYAMEIDFEEQPPMFHVSETHMAATWLLHPNAPKVNPPAIVVERIERMKKEQAEREAAEALQNAKKGAAEA